jgi:hypothetical protein
MTSLSSPVWSDLIVTPLVRAGPAVLAFTGAFTALQGLFAYVIVPRFAPKGLKPAAYGDLVRAGFLFIVILSSQITNTCVRPQTVRGVSTVFSTCVTATALYILGTRDAQQLAPALVYSSEPRAELLLSMATGYFLWDVGTVLYYRQGPAFLFHGVAAATTYFFTLQPFVQYYGVLFLLYELSTPFLNLRGTLQTLGRTHTPAFSLASYAFMAVFVGARMCMGLPASFEYGVRLWNLDAAQVHSPAIVTYFLATNVGLNALNLYWFTLMARSVLRRRERPPTKAL